MTSFSVNPQRFDPYKQFKFKSQLGWPLRRGCIAGDPAPAPHPDGNLSLGRRSERAAQVTSGNELREQWANEVWNLGAGLGTEVSLRDFRKDITIELFNELEANEGAVAFESLTLEHEGWERDYEVTEPEEPSF